jgi:hypothetical protein
MNSINIIQRVFQNRLAFSKIMLLDYLSVVKLGNRVLGMMLEVSEAMGIDRIVPFSSSHVDDRLWWSSLVQKKIFLRGCCGLWCIQQCYDTSMGRLGERCMEARLLVVSFHLWSSGLAMRLIKEERINGF